MSLRHALLGLLAGRPASGYDLLGVFAGSLARVWPATQSQVYGELKRLADDGLVEVGQRGPRGRKEYTVTDRGRAELEHWILDVEPDRVTRNDAMLRVFFLGSVGRARAKAYLERRAAAHEDRERVLGTMTGDTAGRAGAGRGYDHLVAESGLRYERIQARWARWAATRIDDTGGDAPPPHR